MKWYRGLTQQHSVSESDEWQESGFEPERTENPVWAACIRSLELAKATSASVPHSADAPSLWVFITALTWLAAIRDIRPNDPPTSVVREPTGGLIVEWRASDANGDELIEELTFYNDGTIEVTLYRNCKVVEMQTIDRRQLPSVNFRYYLTKAPAKKSVGGTVSMHGFQNPELLEYDESEAYGELEACH